MAQCVADVLINPRYDVNYLFEFIPTYTQRMGYTWIDITACKGLDIYFIVIAVLKYCVVILETG